MSTTSIRTTTAGTKGNLGGRDTAERKWYAVYTMPRRERSVTHHLDAYQVESFLPVYESLHVWRNRQRVKITQPLFPSYLFVRILEREASLVLRSPGAVRIVRNGRGDSFVPDTEIDFLRSEFCRGRIEPFPELVVGNKVAIKSGPMQGLRGILVKKKSSLRFVLTIEMINQNAAVELDAEDLESIWT